MLSINNLNFHSSFLYIVETVDRKSKSSVSGRRRDSKHDTAKEIRYNLTKEILMSEQFGGMSVSEKEKKLAKYIETEFQNMQIDHSRILNYLEHK